MKRILSVVIIFLLLLSVSSCSNSSSSNSHKIELNGTVGTIALVETIVDDKAFNILQSSSNTFMPLNSSNSIVFKKDFAAPLGYYVVYAFEFNSQKGKFLTSYSYFTFYNNNNKINDVYAIKYPSSFTTDEGKTEYIYFAHKGREIADKITLTFSDGKTYNFIPEKSK